MAEPFKIGATGFAIKARRDREERPVPEGDTLPLRGEIEWWLEGQNPALLSDIEEALSGFCERTSETLLLLTFGNAVGFFRIPHLDEIKRIKVFTAKCSENEFDRMLLELTEITSALPFAGHLSGALPYDRSTSGQEEVLYHAFVHLRHALSNEAPFEEQLLPAFKLILSEPHRVFANVRREQDPFLVRRVDPITLKVAASGRYKPMSISSEVRSRLPSSFARLGHIPERVSERHVRTNFDIPENRLVTRVLNDALWLIDKMREVAAASSDLNPLARRVVYDCDELERVLSPISRAPFWRQIGDMVRVPNNSIVLHRRRGYRVIYQHFVKSRLSSQVPIEMATMKDLIEAKDIAKLYEIWAYFALVKELNAILGPPSDVSRPEGDRFQLSVGAGFSVRWPNGTKLAYNLTFSRSKSVDRFAYSVPLRPDMALRIPSGANAGLHLFDAKFRVQEFVESTNVDDEKIAGALATEERIGTFKQADLYKMHTYRDSIEEARSVWILYPGSVLRFFGTDGTTTIDPPQSFDGVGAIPLSPEESRDPLLSTLKSLIGGQTA